MSKKKNKNKAEEVEMASKSESSVDLSSLIDAAKSSFLDFTESTKEVPFGAEKAEVFDSEEIEEIKNSIEAMSDSESETIMSSNELESSDEVEVHDELGTREEQTLDSVFDDIFNESSNSSDGESDSIEATTQEEAFSDEASSQINEEIIGSELEEFSSAAIEELEFIEDTQLESIVESILFATDRPVSLPTLKQIFKGTNVTNARLKRVLESLQVEYAGGRRGVTLEEVGSGYQLRTKVDNMEFLRRSFKAKSFKVSGPALEVLAITAYKQPVIKAEIDEIRGVESGHLLRALMEKNLVLFAGKSDLPGKPMQYGTTRKFLEIFGLRNLKELPTLSQIDELLPEGIGDEVEKPKLADITDGLAEKVGMSYSEGEEELTKITDQLENIDTSSEFFEKEKQRQREQRDAEKAKNLREAIAVGEAVPNRDLNWLKRYEEQLTQLATQAESQAQQALEQPRTTVDDGAEEGATVAASLAMITKDDESDELEQALKAWDEDLEEGNDILHRLEENDIADIDEEI